jgi:hypothetical protein
VCECWEYDENLIKKLSNDNVADGNTQLSSKNGWGIKITD